ncbi:StbB family protein [Candidatus Pantoea formicae]|uniref:StbB family protein n=1 Tax=Candidatus Pantoea formicae TaxID=2608355 RepID=UPI003ED856A9
MYLKIATLNNSGNVGKTTLCETLLMPRLEDSVIIRVETINYDGSTDTKVSAKEYDVVMKKIDDVDCTIIDIGSSNIEQFLVQMNEYQGSHDLIDYFIIPVTTQDKQQRDSIATIHTLLDMGVEEDRIKSVYNFAEKDVDIERQYSIFLSDKVCKKIAGKNPAIVYNNNIFNLLHKSGLKYSDVYKDDRDFRSLIRNAASPEERQELSNIRAAKMLMNGFNSDLDIAFSNLNLA